MKQICHLDVETFSETDIKAEGMYKYAASETTELLCACYAFGDGPVNLWIPIADRTHMPDAILEILKNGIGESRPFEATAHITTTKEPPSDLKKWIEEGKPVAAHNAGFERHVLNGPAGKRLGFPELVIDQMVCTAAKAAAHGLPRHLDGAAQALGGAQKNVTGQNAMRALCRPRTGAERRWTLDTAPEKYGELYLYCRDDVLAERSVDTQVPDLPDSELAVWRLDQKMNDRGVGVDMPRVEDAIVLTEAIRNQIETACDQLTGLKPTQTAKLADWIRGKGYNIKDLTAPILAAAIADPACPDDIRRVLRMRAAHAMKAVDKYYSMALMAGEGNRLRGMFMYHGAGTGRWSSSGVQLQNLFRPHPLVDPLTAIDAFSARDVDWLHTLYPDVHPMTVLASCVRSALAADESHDLLCMDYAQIEARIVAWLAGQMDVLKVFESGQDIYVHAAAQIFGIHPDLVTKEQRFFGKIAVLALGYQGGSGAFTSMAKLYGQHVPVATAESVKTGWREANKKTVQLWYDLERCATNAIKAPGKAYGLANGLIKFKVDGRWLYMLLPSGRKIAYFEPRLDHDDKVSYMGIDTYTRQWGRVTTYGGRLLQNAAEGVARDLLAAALLKLETAGYRPLGSVHDEAITEPEKNHESLEAAMRIFQDAPTWANGLPVAAEGWRGRSYRK